MEEYTRVPFEFRGDGKTYFRIWIVNLFLSVITLGIYSAWAKVRSNRYFYSHLYVDDTSFEYLANPVGILLGRTIALALFVGYTLVSKYVPNLTIWFLLSLVPIVPWIVLKSLQFRAWNSAYRNIRFQFHGTYPRALLVAGIYPLLIVAPFVMHSMWARDVSVSQYTLFYLAFCTSAFFLGVGLQNYFSYVVSNTSYGITRFEFRSRVSEYFGMLTMILFGTIALAFLVVVSLLAIIVTISSLDIAFDAEINRFIGGFIGLAFYVWAMSMFMSYTTNLLYNGVFIPGWYTFESRVTSLGLFRVYLVNTVLILLTLGFYIPFAKIRLINYRVSAISLLSTRPLDEFVFDGDVKVSAMGQEVGEMFGMELGL